MRQRVNQCLSSRFAKPVGFALGLLPFVWLVMAAVFDWLGANPAEALERSSGDWTLRMLCVVLAITPLRIMAGLPSLAKFRRMAGLFVYFYAVLHLLAYSWFDMGFDLADIAKDIIKRPFILVGFTAVVLLTPLALTSFNRAIKALGGKRWQILHRLVYGPAPKVARARSMIAAFAEADGRSPTILVAKMGQDGHDRGQKVIATGFDDLGFAVEVGPLFATPAETAREAVEKGVHVVGASSLAAGHLTLIPELKAELEKLGRGDIMVVVGGVIPPGDFQALRNAGARLIFPPGTVIADAAAAILDELNRDLGYSQASA